MEPLIEDESDETGSFEEIGNRLKSIREDLGHTLKEMFRLTGVSYSYISDFERGKSFPSSKYLKELFFQFKVNINHVLDGEGERFLKDRKDRKVTPDFGSYQGDVDELLLLMSKSRSTLFSILLAFTSFKTQNMELWQKEWEMAEKTGDPGRAMEH